MLCLQEIRKREMEAEPFEWSLIRGLFSGEDAVALAESFPQDRFKKVAGHDQEKSFEYGARSLIHLGATEISHPEGLRREWLALAEDLLSHEYRAALSQLSRRDLTRTAMEVNVVQYGPGCWLGPHVDVKDKVLTHVLYFNELWDAGNGGCLQILKSSDPSDVFAEILPVVGNSVVLVRSKRSWHSVSGVVPGCATSRRSMNVIFHSPGAVSTMWPPGHGGGR